MTKILAFLSLTVLLLGYQNCGKQMDFYKSSDKVSINDDATLTPISDDINDDLDGDIATGANGDIGIVPNDPEPVSNGGASSTDGGFLYICIVQPWPGANTSSKSQRLGYMDSQLATVGSTPRTICTTEKGCHIAGKILPIIGAEKRGFCKNDKAHTVAVSESDMETLVNQ